MGPPNTSSPAIPAKRNLPSKEASLFKELLTLYETRQLKKGQKTADQILKKFPEHGETLCMKGLILTHMGKRDEGIELVKKGVRLDLTSHISWHVFGLIQKGEKNYEEALKSYTQALRFDKDNFNILRDAAQLQAQLRLFDGLVETRHTLLRLRPSLRQHWIGLAVAHHLSGNLHEAKRVLEQYERIVTNVPDHDVEFSECLIYHVLLLEEMGELSGSLDLLNTNVKSGVIVDRTAIMEIRARLLTKLASDEAEDAWRTLIKHNPDCQDYYRGFFANQGIKLDSDPDENRAQVLETLLNFSNQLPQAAVPRRLVLTIATGETFKELVTPYLLSGLTRGVPSLFSDVKSLYKDDQKRQVIEDIVEAARERFDPETPNGPTPPPDEPPTTYLWTLYFLAQHYSSLSQSARSLSLLSIALSHTPTLPELYTCKARVLKRSGDYIGAARCLDEARLLDGQDRFLNTKCAKYRFRAGLVDEAVEVLGLFTKKDASSPGADLEDMQSIFYLIEEADAHYRNGKWNLALKKYCAVLRVFDEIEDDQYDFHGYSLRRFTMSIYTDLVKWEDQLRSHPTYVSAAISASKIWVAVFDDPSIATASSQKTNATNAEKKAKKKAKKAAQKVQEENKKAGNNATSVNEDKGLDAMPLKDDDPDGLKLIASADPLERAAKCLSPLKTLARENVDVWIAVYDVAVRRKKYLQAAQALKQARSLDGENAELHIRTVGFRKTVSSLPQPPPAPIGPALEESLSGILAEDVSLDTFNSQYLQRHSASAPAIIAAAKVTHMLGAPMEEVEGCLFAVLGDGVGLDVKTALGAVAFLTEIKSGRQGEFRSACEGRFELSTVFRGDAALAELRKSAIVREDRDASAVDG